MSARRIFNRYRCANRVLVDIRMLPDYVTMKEVDLRDDRIVRIVFREPGEIQALLELSQGAFGDRYLASLELKDVNS